jgi:hypothetical protein
MLRATEQNLVVRGLCNLAQISFLHNFLHFKENLHTADESNILNACGFPQAGRQQNQPLLYFPSMAKKQITDFF